MFGAIMTGTGAIVDNRAPAIVTVITMIETIPISKNVVIIETRDRDDPSILLNSITEDNAIAGAPRHGDEFFFVPVLRKGNSEIVVYRSPDGISWEIVLATGTITLPQSNGVISSAVDFSDSVGVYYGSGENVSDPATIISYRSSTKGSLGSFSRLSDRQTGPVNSKFVGAEVAEGVTPNLGSALNVLLFVGETVTISVSGTPLSPSSPLSMKSMSFSGPSANGVREDGFYIGTSNPGSSLYVINENLDLVNTIAFTSGNLPRGIRSDQFRSFLVNNGTIYSFDLTTVTPVATTLGAQGEIGAATRTGRFGLMSWTDGNFYVIATTGGGDVWREDSLPKPAGTLVSVESIF